MLGEDPESKIPKNDKSSRKIKAELQNGHKVKLKKIEPLGKV
jgi:hypothetical protein